MSIASHRYCCQGQVLRGRQESLIFFLSRSNNSVMRDDLNVLLVIVDFEKDGMTEIFLAVSVNVNVQWQHDVVPGLN